MSYLGVSGTDSRYCNGMMTADQGISLVAVSDGTSNTLFFGERPPPIGFEYGWLYAGDGQDGFGSLDSVLGVRDRNQTGVNRSAELYVVVTGYRSCGPGPFAYAPPGADRKCDAFRFWSLHVGGANFAFADGSVRFLNYGADAVLPALATRAGGEVVSLE